MTVRPRVLTIPPTTPFLPALARGILDGRLIEGFAPRARPELLAGATIYLPTRRAARALAAVLLEETGAQALLLPRIVPLGDVDEDAFAFEAADLSPLPPALSAGERRLSLATLVQAFAAREFPLLSSSPANAIALADELAHLMDDFITAGLPFTAVANAVEGEFDRYWERSRDFLKLVSDHWNDYLDDAGKIDAAARRDLLLAREAERLARSKDGPVIAAGSTGSVPKVAELLGVIARHAQGAVVLPGLDQIMSPEAFAEIGAEKEPMPGHPQFGLKRLIEKIGIARDAVEPLELQARPEREALLSHAFEPYADDRMQEPTPRGALDGIGVIEAQDAREEALAIAIALRESLDRNTTAALVTPDRALARRVCAALSRWDIAIDDSAGLPLAESEAGRLARLLVDAAAKDAAPSTLLALLRHPYLRHRFAEREIALLEICALRGLRPTDGAKDLARVIEAAQAASFHPRDLRAKLEAPEWQLAKAAAVSLEVLLSPLLAVRDGAQEFLTLAAAHRDSVTAALSEDMPDDCEALCEALDALCESANAPRMQLSDYSQSFTALIRETTLRPPQDEDARIRILGPLEARMISADRIVLGGLCEGIWPPEAHTDAWLNRPMRKTLKLDLPERRIGLSAHDFVQAAGAKEVFFARARKQGGVETIASRFLQRLEAVADPAAWQAAKQSGEKYLRFARSLEEAPKEKPLAPPMPAPPAAARPRRFSMSDMRDLTRDPYSIFARKILRLHALDAIDEDPGAAERGTLVHEIISNFTALHPGALPATALDDMLALGREAFAPMQSYPAAFAIWWPRFKRAARWFVEIERTRRGAIATLHSEVEGSLLIAEGGGFTLTARADRIEVNKDGSLNVLDFKTGTPPSYKAAILGFEPQLLLEAAIALAGGFRGISGKHLSEVGAIKISGGQPPGAFKPFTLSPNKDFQAVAEPRGIAGSDHLGIAARGALEGATRLLAQYADAATPYPFAPRVQWQKDYNDYEHLARFREWSEGGE